MDAGEAIGLAAAAFAAGGVNAVAGGGSLISFPALVAVGYSSKVANITNAVALWPGYVGGVYGYRPELEGQRRRLALLAAPSIAGAVAGSVILLVTPEAAFELVAPILILFACGLLALQPRLARAAVTRLHERKDESHVAVIAATFVLAVYGGYFGAGLGILTLSVLGILLPDDLQRSNALKGALALLINTVAAVVFLLDGQVAWEAAAVMAAAALVGGYAGVRLARVLPAGTLRWMVIVYGLVAAVVLLLTL